MVSRNLVDIKENDIIKYDRELLPILLKDNSSKHNIIWATDNYLSYGKKYTSSAEITTDLIIGINGNIIKPRINKNKTEQLSRIRDKAEVFTPSWVCNKQNNLIDNAWFGRKNIFNIETNKGWKHQPDKIPFPTLNGKTYQDYIKDIRLEVSCGEAPYLVSRYDTISGEPIVVSNRIGLLDRKLRVVSENFEDKYNWYEWTKIAYQSTYGYEWQGDNLLLARENLLFTFIDFHKDIFGKKPAIEQLREIANIISWNIWQMDGVRGVIPNTCSNHQITTYNLFGEAESSVQFCEGCQKDDVRKHNGIYCKIKDWQTGGTLKFISLLKR